jgi:hypothetical protein
MNEKIQVLMSHNEKGSGRDTALARAIAEDTRFSLPEFSSEINVDLKFVGEPRHIGHDLMGEEYCENVFQAELKLPSDYVSTVLGNDGHGAMQYLDMAEAGHRCMFLVLGSDWEVSRAIEESLIGAGYKGSELAFQKLDYENRIRNFEAQAFGLYAPVFRWSIDKRKLPDENLRWPDPYKRLLSAAHKVLTGASMAGYGPRPKDHERQIFSICVARNIGPKIGTALMADYGSIANLCSASLNDLAEFRIDGRRIGPAKATSLVMLLHGEIPGKMDIHIKKANAKE